MTVSGSMLLSGIACLAAGLMPQGVYRAVFSLLGKMFIACCFGGVYSYTTELFPTAARSAAVGLCSTSGRIGGVMAPIIVDLVATSLTFRGSVWIFIVFTFERGGTSSPLCRSSYSPVIASSLPCSASACPKRTTCRCRRTSKKPRISMSTRSPLALTRSTRLSFIRVFFYSLSIH